ncbi:hypothetical protein RCL_jg26235.t1 [Rhizophagus clarus]|uniref:Uncharacterized protein n=1 Tax=Rhizophagus clarus TaxID=94130 RepID=A0A8H3QD70_9GLOM|nr:hypothetical protein RCL_jg26235.t1 [Rhizophagus clarus]
MHLQSFNRKQSKLDGEKFWFRLSNKFWRLESDSGTIKYQGLVIGLNQSRFNKMIEFKLIPQKTSTLLPASAMSSTTNRSGPDHPLSELIDEVPARLASESYYQHTPVRRIGNK